MKKSIKTINGIIKIRYGYITFDGNIEKHIIDEILSEIKCTEYHCICENRKIELFSSSVMLCGDFVLYDRNDVIYFCNSDSITYMLFRKGDSDIYMLRDLSFSRYCHEVYGYHEPSPCEDYFENILDKLKKKIHLKSK